MGAPNGPGFVAATTRQRRKGRRLIAAATVSAALVAPGLLAAGSGALGILPVADISGLDTPRPGNILALLQDNNSVGVNGALPSADSVSPELVAALRDPSQQPPPDPFDPGSAVEGIPGEVLKAYRRAAEILAGTTPGCRLHWSLLAGIGKIESNHARGGKVDINGNASPRILGPQLSGGPGFAAIRDTDNGALDGDTQWDRAVGPMQFIPSTWRGYAADGNADGRSDPNNVYDAALGAGNYLCSGGLDLSNPAQLATAVFRYNHSNVYVRNVLTWMERYAKGVTILPDDPLVPTDPNLTQPPPQGGVTPPPQNPPPDPGNPGPTSSSSSSSPSPSPSPSVSPTPSLSTSPSPSSSTSPSPSPSPTPTCTTPPPSSSSPSSSPTPTSSSGLPACVTPTPSSTSSTPTVARTNSAQPPQ
ncbi:lytic transglycosylase domain-containing protein [Crossiella sp. CA198]|uniref:lytic transglycosylase domain-containing protein n=1 Tax=Crossiella sp. CA198 TaxID=3455607 RepID=UPI003F8D0925